MSFSVNNDNKETSFYSNKYATTPLAKDKIEYSVQKGDNLWNIAKEHINKDHVTNAEILDMMYKIAKLNNKESLEAANNIKINETLYLPVDSFIREEEKDERDPLLRANEAAEEIKDILYPNDEDKSHTGGILAKFQNTENIPKELAAEHAQAGLDYWTDLMNNKDENLIVRKSYSVSVKNPSALEILKKDKNGQTETHMYLKIDSDQKFTGTAFDSPGVNVKDIKFDYETDKNGNISVPPQYGSEDIPIGKADAKSYAEFSAAAQKFIDENVK